MKGTDFLGLDALLTEEEKLSRSSIRRFVEEEINPIIAECFEEGRFPREVISGLASLGVLGANLPEEYGCAGMNNVAYGLVMQELEAGDSGIRSVFYLTWHRARLLGALVSQSLTSAPTHQVC